MNKKLLLSTLALALVPVLEVSASSQTLTITTFTGPWEIAERKCFVEPFEQKTGARVVVDPGVSLVTLTKLRQGKASTGIDVVWMNGYQLPLHSLKKVCLQLISVYILLKEHQIKRLLSNLLIMR